MKLQRFNGFFPRRLHLQVGVIVSVLLIATIGLYAWKTTRTQSENLTLAIKNQSFVIAKNVADLSVNYLLTQDFVSIEALLMKTAEFPDVLSISVTDERGVVLSRVERRPNSGARVDYSPARLNPPGDGKPRITTGRDRIVLWYPVSEGTLFGWVKMEYSLHVMTDLHRRVWKDSLANGIAVVVVCIALLLFFLSRHIRAVGRVTEFAKRLNERKGERIEVDRSSVEIEQLMSALNHASVKLHEQDCALNESAEHLERLRQQNLLILQSAGEGIVGLDLEGRHTFVNPAAARMLGYGHDELIGQPLHETWYRPLPGEVRSGGTDRPIYATLLDGEIHHVDSEVFWRKDGRSFPVAYTTTPIREGEQTTGAVITFLDITGRKRAEEALRESEKKYRTLFEESKDVIFFSTPEGMFIDINPAGVELFGYSSKDEIVKSDIGRDLYVNARYREEFKRAMEGQGYIKDYPVRLRRKDGETLDALITATAVYDENGTIVAYRGILRDVTSERRLEQQLRHAQKMEAVGQLTGGIAHDFNNILSAIMSYIYILRTKMAENDPLRMYVDQILSSTERGAHLTQSLLAFSRKQIITPSPVNLGEIVKRVEPLLLKLTGEEVEFMTVLADGAEAVIADAGQIEQVLMNLATNARDAMPEGGRLSIETGPVELDHEFARTHGFGKPGRYVLLSVTDDGVGMDDKTAKRIFEPFFTTKEFGKGTGLGLSIVYGIIKQHNGYIDVYSEPGKGTTFKIYLPAARHGFEKLERDGGRGPVGGNETVLIAEDDVEVRKTTLALLSEWGYTVIEAVDGEDAVEKFGENRDRIRLLLLDVIMPGKNGKEAYEEIRNMRPAVKALFMSGYTADIIQKKGILDPGLHFISKPASPSDLLRKIREVLDS